MARQQFPTPKSEELQSRTSFAARNSFFGLMGKALTLVTQFIARTAFIYILGRYYLGVNGLYTDILNVLSFAELGFGSAMTFALYGPVARGEEERIVQLLAFYRTVYRAIALVIAAVGLALTPFLQCIVMGAGSLSLFELRLYFLIFLANTVTSYFVTYKYGYLNALQRTYVQTNLETATTVAASVMQIVALFATRSFLVYLLSNTATLVASRVTIALYLNGRYPLLAKKPATRLPREERSSIINEVKGLSVHQFASVAVYATDSIIISAVPALGIAVVGAVSNYNMIINAVSGILTVVLNGMVAGFGNLATSSSKEHFREVFEEAQFLGFWAYGLCSVCILVLISPFIEIWAGGEYLIDGMSLTLIVLNFYLQGQSSVYNNARIAKGNFNMDKWWALAQALVNLVVSVVCAINFGLVGVYIGTVASRLLLVISRPCVTYRFLFGRSPLGYFRDLLVYLGASTAAYLLCRAICSLVLVMDGWAAIICSAIVCLLVSNGLFLLVFGRSARFRAVYSRMKGVVKVRRPNV